MSDNWHAGNAAEDSADYRGWLIGHFIDPSHGTMRKTDDLEVNLNRSGLLMSGY